MTAYLTASLLAASTTELSLRMVLSLVMIGVLALVVLKVSRSRLGLGGTRPGIAVEARHQLTRQASVVVVRAGERHLLLGVSDHQVTLLAEGDDLVVAPAVVPTGEGSEVDSEDADGGPGASVTAPVRASGGRLSLAPRPARRPGPQLRAGGADGAGRDGARKRHGRARRPAPSRMGVIEALRERTVRKG